MNKKILITASILGVLSIVLGAFAAHGLEKLIDTSSIETFETGVRYQMYHAILLLIIGSSSFLNTKPKQYILYLVVLGVLFFSGSIYGLATNELTSFDFKQIALITPIGGMLLIFAWVVMLIGIVKNKAE